MHFHKQKNRECLQGLHYDYELAATIATGTLAAHLDQAFHNKLFHMEEQLGDRSLLRLVYKFVAEIRLGEVDRLVSLIHRVSASPQQRRETEATLERVLEES